MASSRTFTEARVDWLDASALHPAPARPWRVQGDDLPETEGDDDDLEEEDDDEEDEEDDEDEELDEDEEEEEDEEADDVEARRAGAPAR